MDKYLIALVSVCCFALVTATELTIHDYDVQIHPIHGHHGHYGDHHGYATSVRYDKRYHHKSLPIPEYHHDTVYQYVSNEHDDDDGHFLSTGY